MKILLDHPVFSPTHIMSGLQFITNASLALPDCIVCSKNCACADAASLQFPRITVPGRLYGFNV